MLAENDLVVLVDEKGNKVLVRIKDKVEKIKRLGVFNPSILIGKEYGSAIEIGRKKFFILKPNITDKIETIRRKAQIILPKDSAVIALHCDIRNGSLVVEGGTGSGALTLVLANLVAPNGKVISYELRKDFAEFAFENIKKAKLEKNIEIKVRDIILGIDEREADAVILDIPNPWDAVKNAYDALKVSGSFCSYSPLVNQVENTVKELRRYNFIDIKTFENLQREIVVGERGTRPNFEMLAHTGYLTFARKLK
ncbi:MAG: tRNA (adenine-N1)-methyltransferase [Candidatus Thermoplasmatota archaeon]|nr:tRNA (adenine-N1)-methyltransferase [Candidatus Thermoplasmatota archaeon]MDI6887325.1 tRNA (adenine-N1)-methyltransferase [Candidatus Thermoplasmatota archaeon]